MYIFVLMIHTYNIHLHMGVFPLNLFKSCYRSKHVAVQCGFALGLQIAPRADRFVSVDIDHHRCFAGGIVGRHLHAPSQSVGERQGGTDAPDIAKVQLVAVHVFMLGDRCERGLRV